MRPRKKPKQASSQPKPSKSKSKKPSGGQGCKHRTGPNTPADIDELVRKSARGSALEARGVNHLRLVCVVVTELFLFFPVAGTPELPDGSEQAEAGVGEV